MKAAEVMMWLNEQKGKLKHTAREHATMGLTVGALIGLGFTAYFMWHEAPAAQEVIKKKKELDPNASALELAAAALPYMKGTIVAVAVTGGCIVADRVISDARLAAATAFGAAAFSDKQALERKMEKLLGKEKAEAEKAEEIKKAVAKPGENPEDIEVLGVYPNDTSNVKRMQEIALNRIVRCILEFDKKEFWASQMQIEEASNAIQKKYGSNEDTNWVGKPFSMNTAASLIGVDLGDIGDELGYATGTDWRYSITPAFNNNTGEFYFYVRMPKPDDEWESRM